jgi:molecular chaperone GrpE
VASKSDHDKKHRQDPDAPGVIFSARPPEDVYELSDPGDSEMSGSQQDQGAVPGAEQLQKLLAEKQELQETLVRRQADFENFRKRVEKERHQASHRGVEVLAERLLPVLDAFDRAIAADDDPTHAEYLKGFELIRRQLWDALAKQGVTRIESMGKEFNPHFHHAIEQVETTDHAEGIVVAELQPGYMFHEKVLRPAMVRVATAPEARTAHASKERN